MRRQTQQRIDEVDSRIGCLKVREIVDALDAGNYAGPKTIKVY